MNQTAQHVQEIVLRIREMRNIMGYSTEEMAIRTQVTEAIYEEYESGAIDLPFSFIHKCALTFNVGMSDLLEGQSARLSSYTVSRKGHLQDKITEDGIQIVNMAPMFVNKIAEPYWVTYEYSEDLQDQPIHTTRHSGQEFDYMLEGHMKVVLEGNEVYLGPGDSLYYDSSIAHAMYAVDADARFIAVVIK